MGAQEIIPHVVHDADGQTVRLSKEARKALADLIESDAAYIYVPAGTDRDFWNVWMNHWTDQDTGYNGVRIPLADWARAYEAKRSQGGTAA